MHLTNGYEEKAGGSGAKALDFGLFLGTAEAVPSRTRFMRQLLGSLTSTSNAKRRHPEDCGTSLGAEELREHVAMGMT
jgi:hypothetical protein